VITVIVAFFVGFLLFYWIIYPAVFRTVPTDSERAAYACILLCKSYLQNGTDLSSGPCLSNEIIPGWVCDVAHWPREDVDNRKENQCPAYGKTAFHFVEVNPRCEFIRAV